MTQENELKPCPFCGGVASVECIPSRYSDKITFQANCDNDDCIAYQFLGYSHDRRTDAIKAWNTRAPEWQGVDVEKLKKNPSIGNDYSKGLSAGWNDCLDYLAEQGCLPQPPKEGE